jgi:uncharacterized membrane protein
VPLMEYLEIKWLHVLSSAMLFGTGIGSAFYLLLATLGRDARAVAAVSRYVVVTDWLFTATTAVFQPLTGFWMMHVADIAWSTPWIALSLGLYAFAIACWLPVVWIQLRLRDLSAQAAAANTALPRAYWRMFTWWVGLGLAAFIAFLAIFHLMVVKRLPFVPGA